MNLNQVILGQVSTEKSVKGQENDQQVFWVASGATKVDIKKAFEFFWGVKVSSVQTSMTRGKERRTKFGQAPKRLPRKKAVVRIAKGEKFDILKFAGEKKAAKKKTQSKEKVQTTASTKKAGAKKK